MVLVFVCVCVFTLRLTNTHIHALDNKRKKKDFSLFNYIAFKATLKISFISLATVKIVLTLIETCVYVNNNLNIMLN